MQMIALNDCRETPEQKSVTVGACLWHKLKWSHSSLLYNVALYYELLSYITNPLPFAILQHSFNEKN